MKGELLNPFEMRVMEWVAARGPFGVRVSTVINAMNFLAHRGFLAVDGNMVAVTGLGWQAMIAHGHVPQSEHGTTIADMQAYCDEIWERCEAMKDYQCPICDKVGGCSCIALAANG